MRKKPFTSSAAWCRHWPALALSLGLLGLPGSSAWAQAQQKPATFTDPGFQTSLVVEGIRSPTTLAFAPAADGRIFVCQEDGNLRVVKNGQLLAAPFITLNVNTDGERGLIGIAVDPGFQTNHYIYLYYTLPDGSRNRISRFTANGDVAAAGSQVNILDLDPLIAVNHNGGAMAFGKDGKLYVCVGENTRRELAPNLDSYMGKLLRINPDGSAPSDNPFAGSGNSAQRQRVWSYGLRNPYTMSVDPSTGKIFVNNVGDSSWEEINDASGGGRDFGWPQQANNTAEGYDVKPGQTAPIYAYPHQNGFPDGTGCAITGGSFFSPATTNYPAQYKGKYFFLDFCGKWINYFDPSSSNPRNSRQPFAQQVGNGDIVGLETGPDGNLYYLARNGSALFKIVYTAASSAPVITAQPQDQAVALGAGATFSVAAGGSTPLSYQWQKDGVNIAGATASSYTIGSVVAADAGQYRVVVTNGVGAATSGAAALTIATNKPPVAQILTPAAGTTYTAGTTVSFSGAATDPEDGTLPASAFSWEVQFHHNVHYHPGPTIPVGVKNGTFSIPTDGEESADVFYRLLLTVTDKNGARNQTYVDILPQKSTISLASSPAGLTLNLNDLAHTTPYSALSVVGFLHKLAAPSPQTLNGVSYEFVSWSDGGAQTHSLAAPAANTTYTATYRAVPTPPASGQAVTSLTLFNADTDLPIAGYDPLPDGAVLNLATLPTKNLNIRANTNPATVGSVRFAYDGNANYHLEGLAPYAIGGDNGLTASGTPNYNAWTPAVGRHTLTVTPYTKGGGGGTAGTPVTVAFTVTNDAGTPTTPTPTPTPGNLRSPDGPASPVAGLSYAYYEGVWTALPDFAGLVPVSTGTGPLPDAAPRRRDDEFALRYMGYVQVPADGTYTFSTASDDGSRLFIGSQLVVDNDGLHGTQEKSGSIGLKAGLHAITVTFFERGGDQVLRVSYAGPGLAKQVVPASAFFYAGGAAARVATPAPAAKAAAANAALASSVLLYPNPARDEVAISLQVAADADVSVAVYDALGQRVAHLAQPASAGAATLHLPIGQLAAGVYSVAVQCGAAQCVRRLAVVR